MAGETLVVEKVRHRPGQEPERVFYACGPVRTSLADAQADLAVWVAQRGRPEGIRLDDDGLPGGKWETDAAGDVYYLESDGDPFYLIILDDDAASLGMAALARLVAIREAARAFREISERGDGWDADVHLARRKDLFALLGEP